MGEKSDYDLVFIGNYTKDTIISASGTRVVDGGGFNYGAHVTAMMQLKTAAVTRLCQDDQRVVDVLVQMGVDVFPTYTPHSTTLELYYPTSNVDERVIRVSHTAGSFSTDQIEPLQARAFLVSASFRGEVGLEVMKGLRQKDALLAADVQGFVRILAPDGRLASDGWPEKQSVLAYVDILKTDAVEAELLTGLSNIKDAARAIALWGPKEIVLTHRDGVLVLANGEFCEAPFQPLKLVGRSGRGDTCMGSYVAKRLSASPKVATVWAAAVTSLKMEAEGPIKRGVAEVEDLIRRQYSN